MAVSRGVLKVSLGAAVLIALILMGALWLTLKEKGQLYDRARHFVGGTEPMNDAPTTLPREVITWKISLERNGREIAIKYTGVGKHTLGPREHIDNYLKMAARNQFPAGYQFRLPKPIDRPPNQPRETPLSIEHTGFSYMVFILEDLNWHFTNNHDPFEVLKGKEPYYTDPRCAWFSGVTPMVSRRPQSANCRVASFISNAQEDKRVNQDDLGHFIAPFNFYVSIQGKGTPRDRYLPLVIDPDVGYPGGNSPEP